VLALAVSVTGCGSRTRVPAKEKSANGPLTNVLVYSHSLREFGTTGQMDSYLQDLGTEHGFRVSWASETFAPLTVEELNAYDVVVFNNTVRIGEKMSEEARASLRQWFEAGGGIVAIHGAAEHDGTWPWYGELIGANYVGNSARTTARVLVDPAAHDHPAFIGRNLTMTGDAFFFEETWPVFDRAVTGQPNTTVLARVNEETYTPVNNWHSARGVTGMGEDHPVSWVVERDGGRLFYTSLGYQPSTLVGMFGSRHILAGLRWAARAEAGGP